MPELLALKEKAHAYDVLVEHWFFEAFHGSAVARSTEAWNIVHGAKEDLKRRLNDFLARSEDPHEND